jgi:DNA-binding NarL/FixJ family response regulator
MKDIRVLIVEDDAYARDLMALLLARDWRTRVVREVTDEASAFAALQVEDHRLDVIVLDTEIPDEQGWPFKVADFSRSLANPPRVLYTATQGDIDTLMYISRTGFGGYVLKGEILYALASAIALVAEGHTVVTPGIRRIAPERILPKGTHVLDGRSSVADFTQRENDLLRLGIIFNLTQRDIADERIISSGWVSEVLSNVYEKLGMREILSGESPLEAYFEDEAVLQRIRKIKKRSKSHQTPSHYRKAPWMSTLAFHLLTIPRDEEF